MARLNPSLSAGGHSCSITDITVQTKHQHQNCKLFFRNDFPHEGSLIYVAFKVPVRSRASVMKSIGRDIRYTVRQWRRSPGFALMAVLTLGLGIGANTAIFLLTHSILLKSLPVPHPEQLVRYTFRKGESEIGLSYSQYQALASQQGVATGVAAWQGTEAILRQNGQAVKLPVAMATGSIFDVLQLHPHIGRGFDANAGERGVPFQPEALLGYDYWRTTFHGDPSVIGTALNLENHSVTVVGVLPQGFSGIQPGPAIDILLPLSFEPIMHPQSPMLNSNGAFWLTVMGRLRGGETIARAKANLFAIDSSVSEAADPSHQFLNGGFFSSYKLAVESGRGGQSWLRFRYSKPLIALEALCAIMLLLCALNVALLVLSRISGRLHEFAVRNALGATRARIVWQVVVETVLLGITGLMFGGVLGWQLAHVLINMISVPGEPPAIELRAGLVVLLFTAGTSLLAAWIAGLWPAWRASRVAPVIDLKQAGAAHPARRMGFWLITVQVSLGVLLLNVALLLTGTLLSYMQEHSGFSADNVVLAELDLSDSGLSEEHRRSGALEFLRQVQSLPGVRNAALMSMPPLRHGFSVGEYYSRDSSGQLHVNRQTWPESTSPEYFATMGIRILAGRAFTREDISGDRVCILSSSAAAFFFPDGPVLGSILVSGDGTETEANRSSCRVIGVAQDVHHQSLLMPAQVMAYFLLEQSKDDAFAYSTIAVDAASPQLAGDAIRLSAARIFPGTPLPRSWAFRDAVSYDLSRQRLLGSVSGGFAILALTLLASGLFGVLSRAVAEKRREIGVRMALGARRDQIVRGLIENAAIRILIGVGAGTLFAWIAARTMQPLLYGVSLRSPQIPAASLGIVVLVLALAFAVPVTRAASINPADAIRDE